jgi:hypothetical protein
VEVPGACDAIGWAVLDWRVGCIGGGEEAGDAEVQIERRAGNKDEED